MFKWLEIAACIIMAGVVLFFLWAFTLEALKDKKRDKLWKRARKMIEKYKKDNILDVGSRKKLKTDLADTWRQYKKLWEDNMWKEISRKKVEEIEKYLVSEKII